MLARNMAVQGCMCTPHGLEAVAGLEESLPGAVLPRGRCTMLAWPSRPTLPNWSSFTSPRGKPSLLSKACSDNRLPGCWQRGSHRVNFQLRVWRMLPVGLFCGVGEKGGEQGEVSGRSCVLPEQAGHWHRSPSSSSAICSCSARALCHHELRCSSSACASPGQVTQVYSFRASFRVSKSTFV